MTVTIDRSELADLLGWVAGVIPLRPQHPALGGIRLAMDDDNLDVRATDNDDSRSGRLTLTPLAIDGDGMPDPILVSGRWLAGIVGTFRADTIALDVTDRRLIVRAGRSTYSTARVNPDVFPTLPVMPDPVGTLPVDDLRAMVAAVGHPIDVDSPNEGLRGMRMEAGDGRIVAVGASQPRVATASAAWHGSRFAATVPPDAFIGLGGMVGDVTLGVAGSLVGVTDGRRTFTTRCFDASRFVDWRRIVRDPDDATVVSVATADLREVLERAAVAMGDDTAPATFTAYDDDLHVDAADDDGMGSGADVIAATISGPPMDPVRLRPGFVLDVVTGFGNGHTPDRIEILFEGPGRPVMVRPAGDPDRAAIVMPMWLRDRAGAVA